MPSRSTDWGEVGILVPEEEWDRAREILSRSFDDADLDWERPSQE